SRVLRLLEFPPTQVVPGGAGGRQPSRLVLGLDPEVGRPAAPKGGGAAGHSHVPLTGFSWSGRSVDRVGVMRQRSALKSTPGLGKDEIRHIVLEKLRVVYDDWGLEGRPFEDFMTAAGERREDARAFVIALVAALVGGFAEAIDRNNALVARASRRRKPAHALRALRGLEGYHVEGQGGALGEVIDTYFDDHSWTVR